MRSLKWGMKTAALGPSLRIPHSQFRIWEMVSVAGLAPARAALKERALGLLCIHGGANRLVNNL